MWLLCDTATTAGIVLPMPGRAGPRDVTAEGPCYVRICQRCNQSFQPARVGGDGIPAQADDNLAFRVLDTPV